MAAIRLKKILSNEAILDSALITRVAKSFEDNGGNCGSLVNLSVARERKGAKGCDGGGSRAELFIISR